MAVASTSTEEKINYSELSSKLNLSGGNFITFVPQKNFQDTIKDKKGNKLNESNLDGESVKQFYDSLFIDENPWLFQHWV